MSIDAGTVRMVAATVLDVQSAVIVAILPPQLVREANWSHPLTSDEQPAFSTAFKRIGSHLIANPFDESDLAVRERIGCALDDLEDQRVEELAEAIRIAAAVGDWETCWVLHREWDTASAAAAAR